MEVKSEGFYKVVAKCGHVGRKNYVPIQFPVVAESKKEAARIARGFPRVKHNHKDAILNVFEISYDQFLELKKTNDNDPYLKCHSRREQNQTCDLTARLVEDLHNAKIKVDKKLRKDRVDYIQRKNKIIEKYIKEEEYAY